MTIPALHADLRLAGLALAAWLAALTGLHLSTGGAVLLAAAAALLAAVTVAFLVVARSPARRAIVNGFGWTAVAVLLGAVCGAGSTAARLSVRDATEIRELAERRAAVIATLVVRDDARPISGTAGRPATVLVPADLLRVAPVDGRAVIAPARVLVLADNTWRGLLPGQHLTAEGRLDTPRGGDLTAAILTAAGPPQLIDRPSWAQRAAGSLRAGLQRACSALPDEPGGLLPGLVVGDTSRLPPAVEQDFRATGLTHLVAVSGANVG